MSASECDQRRNAISVGMRSALATALEDDQPGNMDLRWECDQRWPMAMGRLARRVDQEMAMSQKHLKIMYCQGKGYYGKEKVKAVSVLMNLGPSGTRREEILQQISTNSQERQKSPCQTLQDTMSHQQKCTPPPPLI